MTTYLKVGMYRTHKLYFSDMDGFSTLSVFLMEAELSAVRDHYDRVFGLRLYLVHYPTDKYNHGKLKDEQHKLQNAVRMLNGTEANSNSVKGQEAVAM